MTKPDVILLNDPTRGIDVGTKQEIYRLLRELADEGAAILFYSTDYDELIGSCDRVAIMYDGRIISELEGDDINEKNIVSASLNIAGQKLRFVYLIRKSQKWRNCAQNWLCSKRSMRSS